MRHRLLILRHGKSSWNQGLPDFERPLKQRGKRNAQQVGVWLSQQQLIPERILSSSAERARNTAEKCIKCMGLSSKQVEQDPTLYLADSDHLLYRLQQCDEGVGTLLLVGHNPGLETLLRRLPATSPTTPSDGKLLPTATLAHLEFDTPWRQLQPGGATLRQLVRGRSLPSEFPYPDVSSSEHRIRPAYYYTQSAVIPYRISDGALQILVIGSSSGRHKVVPKGIVDPGLTPQQSAAQEAEEEAGISGRVAEQPLGSYHYTKWEGRCEVKVYPLEVTHLLSPSQWQERHRGRTWIPATAAIEQLQPPELGQLVAKLQRQLQQHSS